MRKRCKAEQINELKVLLMALYDQVYFILCYYFDFNLLFSYCVFLFNFILSYLAFDYYVINMHP